MLLFALLGCPSEPVGPVMEELEVRAFRSSWDGMTEPVGAALVGLDDASGTRTVLETDNSGVVTFEVDPDDGPFTVTVLSYDNWPHAMTRMGLEADNSPVEFAFSPQEWELFTVTLRGTAEPRARDTNLVVTAHQPDLTSWTDTTGDHWAVGVLPDEDVALLATEYVERQGAHHGEYTRDFVGWYRAHHDPMEEDAVMALDLDKHVRSFRAGGQMWMDDGFMGAMATMGGTVYSESSLWHNGCGWSTLAARRWDRAGWYWAMEWAPPTLTDEDLVTEMWATAPGLWTYAVRHAAPDAMGNLDMLPGPVLDPDLSAPGDLHYERVPDDARPVAYIVDNDAPSDVLWMIEGAEGSATVVVPEPMDTDLLPDNALSVQPGLLRRDAADPYLSYDIAWGEMVLFE